MDDNVRKLSPVPVEQAALSDRQSGQKTISGTVSETVSEIGGPKGPEPTRYGDWESNGRCSDF